MAPFDVHLLALNYQNSEAVKKTAESLYRACSDAGLEVLLDDRDERPGIKFAEADLIGIPHRITIGERNLKDGLVEYKKLIDDDNDLCKPDESVKRITSLFNR